MFDPYSVNTDFGYLNQLQVLKTAASGLGFQHLPRGLANVNAWKTLFDPYSVNTECGYLNQLPYFSEFEQINLSS